MSSELKRNRSESSVDGSTKRLRSVERQGEGLPAGAVVASATEPSSTPQSPINNPQHPPELTPEQYQRCLDILRSTSNASTDISWILSILLSSISQMKPGVSPAPDEASSLLQSDRELQEHLERREFEKVLNSRTIFTVKQKALHRSDTVRSDDLVIPKMQRAVSTAWKEPYKSSGDILENVLKKYIEQDTASPHYARYASITQSSGTGKSRMVDELAKKIFCIPMSLGSDQAYPPRDVDLLSWFESLKPLDDDVRTKRVQLLMVALFETALERVKVIASDPMSRGQSLASVFRQLMSEGMAYGQHGQYRQKFHKDVCERAKELLLLPESSGDCREPSPAPVVSVEDEHGDQISLTTAAKALTSYLSTIPKESSTTTTAGLDVILYFDEAQLLTLSDSRPSGATLFSDVRRALRLIRALPIFSLFLSTVGKLEQFSPPPQLDSSARIMRLELVPFAPIVWTPLDVLAQRITKNKVWTLREVASTYHIAHLGRPLFPAMYDAAVTVGDHMVCDWIVDFACKKLLKTEHLTFDSMTFPRILACIAVRIPIEFNPVPLSRRDASVERDLVADHMRLLLYAGAGFSPIITTSASEPLLAEAACRLMISGRWSDGKAQNATSRGDLDPLVAITHYLGNSLLDLGERGEFAAALLLLYARDCATTFVLEKSQLPGSSSSDDGSSPEYDGAVRRRIVTVRQFLQALLGTDGFEACAASLPLAYHTRDFATTPLRTAFQEAFIYFNHFIKAQSYEVVHQAYLLLAISRGAAIICANGHVGIDIVVPVLIGTSLKKENVTAILVQVRNSRHYGAKIKQPVFANMDPYLCGLFDRDVKEPPPVLRMVFALASPDAAVASPSVPVRKSRHKDKTANFTAYDIWCAGASHKTFAVIEDDEDAAVAKLLKLIRNARDVSAQTHLGESVQRALRQMQPLVSTNREHTELFSDLTVDMGECALAEDAGEDVVE